MVITHKNTYAQKHIYEDRCTHVHICSANIHQHMSANRLTYQIYTLGKHIFHKHTHPYSADTTNSHSANTYLENVNIHIYSKYKHEQHIHSAKRTHTVPKPKEAQPHTSSHPSCRHIILQKQDMDTHTHTHTHTAGLFFLSGSTKISDL